MNDPQTTHKDFLAMRQAIDARRDEKQRLEQVALKYKTQNLQQRILSTRAQMHCQFHQQVRAIRDDYLTRMNTDYCQVQRERRQFIRKEPQYSYNFETDRSKQVENQTKYNKEVSLLSGIAQYKGFPGAPDLQSVREDDHSADFRAMQVLSLYFPHCQDDAVC